MKNIGIFPIKRLRNVAYPTFFIMSESGFNKLIRLYPGKNKMQRKPKITLIGNIIIIEKMVINE